MSVIQIPKGRFCDDRSDFDAHQTTTNGDLGTSWPACCCHVIADSSAPNGEVAACECGAEWKRFGNVWSMVRRPDRYRPRTVCQGCHAELSPEYGIRPKGHVSTNHGWCLACAAAEAEKIEASDRERLEESDEAVA